LSSRVIVVGAGPGGLAVSLLLARAGLDVTVFERAQSVGGRTSGFTADGFRFDAGTTALIYPQAIERIFRSVGRELHAEVELRRLDPHGRIVFGTGGELITTSDDHRMTEAIARLSPRDARSFARFLEANRRRYRRLQFTLETPCMSLLDLLSLRRMAALPWLASWRTLYEDQKRFFHDPRIRHGLSFQWKYIGMSPYSAPAMFSFLTFLELEHSVYHPMGGCHALSEAMARIARDMGVSIRLGEPVARVIFQGRRAVGVVSASGESRADAVVINADFARAMTDLVPASLRHRWSDDRLAHRRHSCSAFMMYLGIEGRYERVAHHTTYLSRDYARNVREVEERHVLSDDPSFYVQNPCVTDPSLAPDGMSTLYVLVPVPHRTPNVTWSDMRDRFRAVTLRQLAKVGIADLEPRIRFERIVTPDEWEHQHRLYRGAAFGLAHTSGQILYLRPHNRFEETDGLYLVGSGTHPGSGLPLIFNSAVLAARLLLHDLQINTDFMC
jgi:phytoene desaturase